MNVNVTVENLAHCKKQLRVEVDVETVDRAYEATEREFQKQARLPGFRPGKAPRHLILKSFGPQLEDEVRRKLLADSFRDAVREKQLHVIGKPSLDGVQIARGQALSYTATVETAPDIELPEYKGLPVRREARVVTPEDVERAIDVLREQRATYLDVARPVQDGDFVVVHYQGTCDGQPITEIAPTARGLTEKKDFWLHVAEGSFIPGFTQQLIGAQAGEKRTVTVQFPADFVASQLSNRTGVYEVEVVQVKEKHLPELNDDLAKAYGAEGVDRLREGVYHDLENELNHKLKRDAHNQLIRELLNRVTCELPASVVEQETRNAVYDIVRENQQRGVAREAIDQQKDQIFAAATHSAKERIKASFIFGRIAQQEGITTTEQEVAQHILVLAQQNEIAPDVLAKQLRDRDGLVEIENQIITNKVLDFLEQHARFEEVLPGAPR
jgi:trigger factor